MFTRTKFGANNVAEFLCKNGINAMALHGNKSQSARTQALAGFKSGDIRALVATDIAARGIDIDDLPHVVNYEIPNVPRRLCAPHRPHRPRGQRRRGREPGLPGRRRLHAGDRALHQAAHSRPGDRGFRRPSPARRGEPIAMGRQTIWGGAGKPPSREVMMAAAKAARQEMMQRIRDNKGADAERGSRNGGGRNGSGNGSGNGSRNGAAQPPQGQRAAAGPRPARGPNPAPGTQRQRTAAAPERQRPAAPRPRGPAARRRAQHREPLRAARRDPAAHRWPARSAAHQRGQHGRTRAARQWRWPPEPFRWRRLRSAWAGQSGPDLRPVAETPARARGQLTLPGALQAADSSISRPGHLAQRQHLAHGAERNGLAGHAEHDAAGLILGQRVGAGVAQLEHRLGAVGAHSGQHDADRAARRAARATVRNSESTDGRCRFTGGSSVTRSA